MGGGRLFCVFTLLSLLFVWISGCQKKDLSSSKQLSNQSKEIPDWVVQKFKNLPSTLGYGGDTTSFQAIVLDRYGNLVTSSTLSTLEAVPCQRRNRDFIDNSFGIKGEFLTFSCSGFKVKATIKFTTAFTFEFVNPLNSSENSRISFRVKDVNTNSILYSENDVTINATDVENLGPNSSNPDLTDYMITFNSSLITSPSSPVDVYFEYKPYIYTDCPDASITTPFDEWINRARATNYYSDPCNRWDGIGITANGSGGIVYFAGADYLSQVSTSCYPSGFTKPTETQIQWRMPSSSTWSDLQFSNPYGCSPGLAGNLPAVQILPYYGFASGTGNVIFRYRNIKRSSNNGCTSTIVCTGDDIFGWSDEVTINVL